MNKDRYIDFETDPVSNSKYDLNSISDYYGGDANILAYYKESAKMHAVYNKLAKSRYDTINKNNRQTFDTIIDASLSVTAKNNSNSVLLRTRLFHNIKAR